MHKQDGMTLEVLRQRASLWLLKAIEFKHNTYKNYFDHAQPTPEPIQSDKPESEAP